MVRQIQGTFLFCHLFCYMYRIPRGLPGCTDHHKVPARNPTQLNNKDTNRKVSDCRTAYSLVFSYIHIDALKLYDRLL